MYRLSFSQYFKEETKINKGNKMIPTDRFVFDSNTKTDKWLGDFFAFVKSLETIFGDGYQWQDALAIAGLTPTMIGMLAQLNDVKEEAKTLTDTHIKHLTGKYAAVGLSIFWKDNKEETAKYGIENMHVLINELADIVLIAMVALKDGIKVDDVRFLPDLFSSAISIVNASSKAFIEAKHLSAVKVGELVADMLGKILFIVR